MLWSALAHAGLSEAELAQTVQDLQDTTRMRLLLGAVGPESEDTLNRIVKDNEELDVVVIRLPTAGDPARELWRALNNSGLTCALRVEAGPGRTWEAAPFGNCTPQAAPTIAAVVVPGAVVDPTAEPDAPVAEPEPVAPVAVVVPTVDLANRYLEERLAVTTGPREPEAWSITDGAGDTLSAPTFASISGDQDATAAMLREQQRALTASTGLRIGGAVVAASALAPLVSLPSEGAVREDRVWTSLFLLSTGLFSVVVAPRTIDAINERQQRPDNYYPRDQADNLVAAYNETLQRDLGLLDAAPQEPAVEAEPEEAPEPPEEEPAPEEGAP